MQLTLKSLKQNIYTPEKGRSARQDLKSSKKFENPGGLGLGVVLHWSLTYRVHQTEACREKQIIEEVSK